MIAPVTRADALENYRKAKEAHFANDVMDLYRAAFTAGVLPEFVEEMLTTLVILGDWLIEGSIALERLTEVNDELSTALHAKVEMFRQVRAAAPDTMPVDWDSAPIEAQLPDLVEVVAPDEVFPDGAAPPAPPSGDFGVRWKGTAEDFAQHGPAIIAAFAREVAEVSGIAPVDPDSHAEREDGPEA